MTGAVEEGGMIETVREDGMTTVTMNRPERRNALTPEALRSIEQAVTKPADPVVYLTGAGRAFSAGADLAAIDELDTHEDAETFARLGQSVADGIERSESIVVAGIDGPARGGGVELALAADLRVATPEASFAESGVALGLFGAWGGTVRLPEVVGLGPALDLALTGRTITAEEANAIGLVSTVTDSPREVAQRLTDLPPTSLITIKERLRDRSDRDTKLRRERQAFAELVAAGPSIPD